MPFTKTIFFLLLALCRPVVAGSELEPPNTHLGATNFEGKIYTWLEVESVQVPNAARLPLRLLLSALPPSGVPVFGKFWWCPLFESTLVPVSESTSLLSTLGGSSICLVKKKDGTMASTDGAWKGKPGINDQVEVDSPGGWTYIYRGGRLVEAVCNNGTRLRWSYENNLFKSLSDSRQGKLVSVEYGPEGLPARISTPTESLECEIQKVPVVANAGISGFEYSLAGISSGSRFWRFPVVLSPEGDYSMAFSNSAPSANTYVWHAASGILKSEGGWTYEVTKREDGRLLVSRKNRNGGVESYFYDDKTGASEQHLPDGSVIKRAYFLGLGPTQYKIRSMVKLVGGKETDSTRWSYDEVGRLIRKQIGNYEHLWSWRPDGRLASESEIFSGKVLKQSIFDGEGRISERTVRDRVYRYGYDGARTSVQKLQSGQVVSTKVVDSGKKQAFFFVPDTGGGLKAGASFAPGSTGLNARDAEVAKSVASRAFPKHEEQD